ncbi:MAG: rhodanese-like domain-containing protein [Planctomycetota bacterium]|nr:rhodanese-like domain-containing protein [Planctomycetota bacterium]
MDWIPIALGGLALLLALISLARAGAAAQDAATARADAQRRAGAVEEELRAEISGLRRMVGMVASGETLTREMIEDGQLWRDIDPREAAALVEREADAFVLDVRTPQETAAGVIEGAILIPMDELEERRRELPDDGRPMLVYCSAGGRSAAVCDHLSKEGFDNLHNLTGGFGAWPGPKGRPAS